MAATGKTVFESYLSGLDEDAWAESLDRILLRIHPTDTQATQIWFAFWPLKLRLALDGCPDPAQVFKDFQLDGKPQLEDQIDASVAFLFGSNYWPEVKQAVVVYAEETLQPQKVSLYAHILKLSGRLAAKLQVEEAVLTGIAAVAMMVLRQIGLSSLVECAGNPAPNRRPKSKALVLKFRKGRGRVWKSLYWKSKRYRSPARDPTRWWSVSPPTPTPRVTTAARAPAPTTRSKRWPRRLAASQWPTPP